MLAERLDPIECVGVDFDAALVAYARAHEGNRQGVRFETGNAMELEFEDDSFDMVFVRNLLVHLPDPQAAVSEMMRMVKPGGKVIAYEPDFAFDAGDPDSLGLTQMTKVWRGMFAHPLVGRTLANRFAKAGAIVEPGGELPIERGLRPMRRTYRMTLEAMKDGIPAKGIESMEEYEAHLEELKRLEGDAETVLYKFPDSWVVATKPER